MDLDTTKAIWELMELNLGKLEGGPPQPGLMDETQVALGMLLECEADKILICAHESRLPTRAMVSWLAYEGRRLGLDNRAEALEKQWDQELPHQAGLISPPARMQSDLDPAPIRV